MITKGSHHAPPGKPHKPLHASSNQPARAPTAPACAPFYHQAFGKLVERYFLPGLVVLGVICGAIAARSYEEGATAYIKT